MEENTTPTQSPALRRLTRLEGLMAAAIWEPSSTRPSWGTAQYWPSTDPNAAFIAVLEMVQVAATDHLRILMGERSITALRFPDGVVMVAELPTGHHAGKSLLRAMRRAHQAAARGQSNIGSRRGPATTVDEWNERHPVGTPVDYQPVRNVHEWEHTKTRSAAWALGDGTPVVMVEGRSGGVALSHLSIRA